MLGISPYPMSPLRKTAKALGTEERKRIRDGFGPCGSLRGGPQGIPPMTLPPERTIMDERRKHARIQAVHLTATDPRFLEPDGGFNVGRTLDVSQGGVAVEMSQQMPPAPKSPWKSL